MDAWTNKRRPPTQTLRRNSTPPSPLSQRAKRSGGGQPGNQNARKHGFYANTLTPEQEEAFAEALEIRDFGQEVALVRVRLLTLLQNPETPPELITRIFNNLCRVMEIQRRYRFG